MVHGAGVDELPLDGSGVLYDITPTGVEREEVRPAAVGLRAFPTSVLAGGSPADNARLVEGVLSGEDRGPRRDVVLLNAGAAFVVAGRSEALEAGCDLAAEAIDSGLVADLLGRLRSETRAAAQRNAAQGSPA